MNIVYYKYFFLHFHCKLTINKFVKFTYSCAPPMSTFAPTFSEPSMILVRRQEHNIIINMFVDHCVFRLYIKFYRGRC